MQLENSHGGFAGKSLINMIQDSLDKGMVDWNEAKEVSYDDELKLQGYVAGMAKALGILRGTSVKTEIDESRQRLSERKLSTTELIDRSA